MRKIGNELEIFSVETEAELKSILEYYFTDDELNDVLKSLRNDFKWTDGNIAIIAANIPNDNLMYSLVGNPIYFDKSVGRQIAIRGRSLSQV